jgi:hypothetical protein
MLRALIGALSASSALSCTNEYPIRPTFCDDFCQATLRPGCDTEPENCVRECELQSIGPQCHVARDSLLRCYRAAPDDAFECSGFSGTRVKDGVCQAERDAMLICELPQMEPCLEVCRPYQALLDEQVQAPMDAGVTEACPLLHQSCEGICWNLLSIGTLDAEELRDASVPRITLPEDASPNELLASVAPLLDGCGL